MKPFCHVVAPIALKNVVLVNTSHTSCSTNRFQAKFFMKTIQTLHASYKLISRGDVLLQVFDPLTIVAIKVIIQASDH